MKPIKPRIEKALFVFIMLCAVGLRVIGLLDAPPGFSDYELSELRITNRVRAGQVTVFYDVGDEEGAREGFYYPVLVVFTGLIGDGLYGYRLLGVFAGALTMAFTYGFARRLFGPSVALLALGGMAVSYWPVHTARMVSRETLAPLFAAAAGYYLVRGLTLRPTGPGDQMPAIRMTAGGILMGMALYVHWTGIAILTGFLLFGVYLGLRYPRIAYRQSGAVGFALLTTFIIAVPFSVSALRARDASALVYYVSRLPGALPDSIAATLGGLFWQGDMNPAHNLPGSPIFGLVGAFAFLVGLAVAVRYVRKPRYALAAIMVFVALLPHAIAPGGPDFTRLTIALPALYLVAGLGMDYVIQFLTRSDRWSGARTNLTAAGVFAIVAALFIAGAGLTWHKMQVIWAGREDVFVAYRANLGRLAPSLDATARTIPTTICSPSLTVYDPKVLSDREILRFMLHQDDLPLRYADCRNSLVLADGGKSQRIAFTYTDGPALLPAELGVWLGDAKPLDFPGLPPRSVFEVGVETPLHDLLGSFITTAPAGFAPESPGGPGPVQLPVRFGGNVTFVGYQIGSEEEVYHPGDTIPVITYWRVDGQAPSGLRLFVHVLSDPQGTAPIAQNDQLSPIVDTLLPDDIFVQYSLVYLPRPMLEGDYDISIGLYTVPDGERLSVLDNEQPRGDHLFLRQIYIADGDKEQ
ncbi:MAG: glycosyltransferase family 39 protein [Anaerolineae bacterium]|nr:glycosyltransferase family 39 protein [Anaerolineae bacterium]